MQWANVTVLVKQPFVRFVLVGVLNTAFAYGMYAALLWLGLPYALANLGSLVLGIAFSFVTQGRLVFGNRDNRLLPRFAACWVILYFVNVGLIALLIRFGMDAYSAGALALLPMAISSFFVQRYVVFGGARKPARSDKPSWK
jgi:putative flippase GtrA